MFHHAPSNNDHFNDVSLQTNNIYNSDRSVITYKKLFA